MDQPFCHQLTNIIYQLKFLPAIKFINIAVTVGKSGIWFRVGLIQQILIFRRVSIMLYIKKKAVVKPLHKNAEVKNCTNYRPMTLLSTPYFLTI